MKLQPHLGENSIVVIAEKFFRRASWNNIAGPNMGVYMAIDFVVDQQIPFICIIIVIQGFSSP